MNRSSILLSLVAALALLFPTPARAQVERLCDPGVRGLPPGSRLTHIRAETVRLDVAFWFMEDSFIASEIIKRHPGRRPGSRAHGHAGERLDPAQHRPDSAELQAAGIPDARARSPAGILHWKMMLFAGQGIVEISGANYSTDAWRPAGAPYTQLCGRGDLFTSKPSVVNSFKTRFDDLWTNTTQYLNYANVTGPLLRAHGSFVKDPELNFPPGESFATRSVQSYYAETQRIDAIMLRITDRRHSDALIAVA